MTRIVRINVELTADQAEAFAQFLKRATFEMYQQKAGNQAEAYLMIDAGERVRDALRDAGYSPR